MTITYKICDLFLGNPPFKIDNNTYYICGNFPLSSAKGYGIYIREPTVALPKLKKEIEILATIY